jgi:hypothetical protein
MNADASITGQDRVEMARQCLRLIRDVAERCASASDPANVGYGVQELSQVLFERTGSEDRVFEPVDANQIGDLPKLYSELQWIDGFSQDLCAMGRRNRR